MATHFKPKYQKFLFYLLSFCLSLVGSHFSWSSGNATYGNNRWHRPRFTSRTFYGPTFSTFYSLLNPSFSLVSSLSPLEAFSILPEFFLFNFIHFHKCDVNLHSTALSHLVPCVVTSFFELNTRARCGACHIQTPCEADDRSGHPPDRRSKYIRLWQIRVHLALSVTNSRATVKKVKLNACVAEHKLPCARVLYIGAQWPTFITSFDSHNTVARHMCEHRYGVCASSVNATKTVQSRIYDPSDSSWM